MLAWNFRPRERPSPLADACAAEEMSVLCPVHILATTIGLMPLA
jgi:hypothetical protein